MAIQAKVKMGFIDRAINTTCIVLLIFFPFGIYYLGLFSSLAILSGAIWSILNLILISKLVKATIRPDGPQTKPAVWIAVLKIPVLYTGGIFLLKVPKFEPLFLVIGFSSVLAIIVLKLAGGMIVGLDQTTDQSSNEKGISAV